MKKHVLFFIFLAALFFANVIHVRAQIVIDEIMYDVAGADSGREWIEVVNTGNESLDFSQWKLFENKTNHSIKSSKGNTILSPGTLAVVAANAEKFMIDNPNFPGVLFESAFSLSNTGETLGLKDATLNLVHQISYTQDAGANGDGNSFQKVDGTWYAAAPTPGSVNEKKAVSLAPTPTTEQKSFNVDATISGDTNVGSKITFSPAISDANSQSVTSGKITWNFGDGTTKTISAKSTIEHNYQFSGKYAVILIYIPSGNDQSASTTKQLEMTISDAAPLLTEEVKVPKSSPLEKSSAPVVIPTPDENSVVPSNLTALAIGGSKQMSLSWWIFALAGILFLSAGVFAFLHRKPQEVRSEDEFEIIE